MYPRKCISIFRTHLQVDMYGEGVTLPEIEAFTGYIQVQYTCVLLPENLHTYFELSAQAWILYKAPQWNARYPNSCPE